MKIENQTESRLQQFMTYGSSLCGAAAAAALQSFSGGISFKFSIYTLVAAIVGFAMFVAFWKLLFSRRKDKRTKLLLGAVTAVLIAGGLAGVLYPLKFVARTEFPQLVTGLVAAALALSGGVILLIGCKRFFDADEQKNTEVNHPPGNDERN